MNRTSPSLGLVVAVIAAAAFGTSGAFAKPLLEAGWSPAAAVAVRALAGGVILAPIAVVRLRGNWPSLWQSRWRILGVAVVGVAGTQLAYFAAIQRIPVSTGILIEYLAPLLLVGVVWVRSRRTPKPVVLIGSVVAIAGLVLVVSPDGTGRFDLLGLGFALMATVCLACYFLIAARPGNGLPAVTLASVGLIIGGLALALIGATGIMPFTAYFGKVPLFGSSVPWWVPLAVVAVVATAIAYAASIASSEILGSRVASFVGLLEVVTAALYAWILLGETLTMPQLVGGVLILAGIGFVRAEKADVPIEPASTGPIEVPESLAPPEEGGIGSAVQGADG